MTLGIIISLAVAALCVAMVYALLKSSKPEKETASPVQRETMRCGTPYLRNGGTLVCQTGDIIEIVTREGTETMTVDEYEARKEKRVDQERPI
jgi:putative hemolysin